MGEVPTRQQRRMLAPRAAAYCNDLSISPVQLPPVCKYARAVKEAMTAVNTETELDA